MLRVDVEEEDSVLLVPAKKCLLGPCKNTPWKSLEYPEMTCDGRSHAYILVAHSHPPWF